jgi:hypothetical protein
MDMQPVESSNIAAMGYDEEDKRLRVTFKSGATYDYLNVEPETHATVIGADSVGSAFHRLIRAQPATYPYLKVVED